MPLLRASPQPAFLVARLAISATLQATRIASSSSAAAFIAFFDGERSIGLQVFTGEDDSEIEVAARVRDWVAERQSSLLQTASTSTTGVTVPTTCRTVST